MIDHQADGLVLVSPLPSTVELEQVAANVPLVVGHHSRSEEALITVAADDEAGPSPSLTTSWSWGTGASRSSCTPAAAATKPARECHHLQGFERAMHRHGLDNEAIVLDSRWNLDGGRKAGHFAGLAAPPTAVHAGRTPSRSA
jgi:LacI family transcriptional regulator